MSTLLVRPYRHADRDALRAIAANTAFFGEPVERFLEDRHLFCDLMYLYYTDLEPERAWIACRNQEAAGFLVGCLDTAAKSRQWRRHILPFVSMRLLQGQYKKIGRRSWRFAVAQIQSHLRYGRPHVDLARYPAHLHINVPGVHLKTTNLNVAACRLYEKVGFQLLNARPTQAWAYRINRPVESRCYGLRFK